jgi:murein L,D-transpeptidase YafK
MRLMTSKRTRIVMTSVAFAAVLLGAVLVPTYMQTMETGKPSALPKLTAPRLVIRKKARALDVYDGERLVKTYTIALGFAPEGDKEREGDGKTPEGEFYVFTKNPKSQFYLSLGLSYPSKDDARRGLDSGLISIVEHDAIVKAINSRRMPPQKTKLGGEIYIHGGGTETDWTWGCTALTNEDIEELFRAVEVGTRVDIIK